MSPRLTVSRPHHRPDFSCVGGIASYEGVFVAGSPFTPAVSF